MRHFPLGYPMTYDEMVRESHSDRTDLFTYRKIGAATDLTLEQKGRYMSMLTEKTTSRIEEGDGEACPDSMKSNSQGRYQPTIELTIVGFVENNSQIFYAHMTRAEIDYWKAISNPKESDEYLWKKISSRPNKGFEWTTVYYTTDKKVKIERKERPCPLS